MAAEKEGRKKMFHGNYTTLVNFCLQLRDSLERKPRKSHHEKHILHILNSVLKEIEQPHIIIPIDEAIFEGLRQTGKEVNNGEALSDEQTLSLASTLAHAALIDFSNLAYSQTDNEQEEAEGNKEVKKFKGPAYQYVTDEDLKILPALYGQEDNPDKIAYVKLFTPDSSWTWYILEYDPEQRLAFGWVEGLESEFGYFSLAEIEELRGPMGLPIERDLFFQPTPLSEVKKRHSS